MELLDLPPELFDMVIRLHVNNHGVREASKIRTVCKPFQSYLDDEIFARQPVGAFLRTKEDSARTLLKNKLGTHLAHRALNIDKPFGAHDFLPKFLKGRLDLLRIMNVMKNGQEYAYAFMLANQLAIACPSASSLATQRSTAQPFQHILPKFNFGLGNQAVEQIAAAAAVGCLEVIQYLIRIYGSKHLWDSSYGFGHPLAAAAGGNHMKLAQAIVANCKDSYRKEPNEAYKAAFMSAIDISLTRQHSEMSLFLAEAYYRYFPVVSKYFIAKWLAKAAVDPDGRIYLMLDTLPTDVSVRKHIEPFELACKSGKILNVRRFFVNRILDPNQGFLLYQGFMKTPLYIAIGADNWSPVEVLLSLGAHPDGVPTCRPTDRPLWRAVEKNNLDIFVLLLLWGADRGLIVQQWNSASEEFKHPRLAILPYLRWGVRNRAIYWKELARRTVGRPELDGSA